MSLIISQKVNPNNVKQHYWKYAIPSISAMLVSGLYQIIDGIFVGHYIGFEGLAGINLAWPIISGIIGVGMMIGMGAGSLLSISRGENNPIKSKRILNNAIALLIGFSIMAALFIQFFAKDLLLLQKAEGENLSMAMAYIDVFVYGAFFTTAATAIPLLIRNDENPAIATQLMVLGACVNIILDYLLIVLYPMGLHGAALATMISQTLVVILGGCYFMSSKSNTKLQFSLNVINVKTMGSIMALGLSSLFMFMYFSFIIALHNYSFMVYGSAVHVAAFAIIGYIATMFYLIAEGIAGGMQPPVSYYYGKKQIANIKTTVILATKVVCIFALLLVVVLNLFPSNVLQLFSHGDGALMAEALIGIRLHLFALILEGIIFVATVYFMAVNQGRKSLTISISNMLIQLPFLMLLPLMIGVNGIWLAVPLSNISLCLLLMPMVFNELKRIKKIDEQHQPVAVVQQSPQTTSVHA
ncbi:multidrug efflux protein [Shewanella sp. 10N.286.52.C2]|uniref:MATE family efflux transporter n=1 Tax=Shewanella sp. 10N.286.52.C2 TaxID=1880838 RepID=UPI000CB86375|nr:MATE family efflux transporter [Shewanella sp. 10N.286.52.C2]PMG28529.1 multidrug efflux protein [Shewanella sp. 10N.286.52.C2]